MISCTQAPRPGRGELSTRDAEFSHELEGRFPQSSAGERYQQNEITPASPPVSSELHLLNSVPLWRRGLGVAGVTTDLFGVEKEGLQCDRY